MLSLIRGLLASFWFYFVQVSSFSVMLGRVLLDSTSTITKQRVKYLTQGHNTAPPLRLEPESPRSSVKHSTTEPTCSSLAFDSILHVVLYLYVCMQ